MNKEKVKIISLGGQAEAGSRNMILFDYDKKILIVDMGLGFPSDDMPGIDCLIPNSAYLRERKKDIIGAILTHGHYDHIGAIPFTIPRIGSMPMYGSDITREIVLKRQEDFPNQPHIDFITVKDGDKQKIGPFNVEFFHLNHNIPGTLGCLIEVGGQKISFVTDFKFDPDPVYDKPVDFKNLERIGNKGIDLLLSESTGAEQEGHSLSEKTIYENLETIFKDTKGRIFASTFASNLNRLYQIIDLSEKYNRKVILEGRSIRNNVDIAKTLKILKIKKGTIIRASDISKYDDNQVTVVCTGAQGEGGATFRKIANLDHKFIRVKEGDTMIFSSSVVPGNERSVQELKDDFYRQGAFIYHYKMMDIHASGHAKQDELQKMVEIMKPKFFMPIFGQYSMLMKHRELAERAGVPHKNTIISENGQVLELTKERFIITPEEVPANLVMVDGLGVGDVGEIVLRDRQALARDGMFVVVVAMDKKTGMVAGSPDIISRGFVYLRESKDLLKETRRRVVRLIDDKAESNGAINLNNLKDEIRSKVMDYLFYKTKRRPTVLVVIIEV